MENQTLMVILLGIIIFLLWNNRPVIYVMPEDRNYGNGCFNTFLLIIVIIGILFLILYGLIEGDTNKIVEEISCKAL